MIWAAYRRLLRGERTGTLPVVVAVLLSVALGGCGAAQRRPADRGDSRTYSGQGASKNYDARGVWLGERVNGSTRLRECGYLTYMRYTAWDVRVFGVTCAGAAVAIERYLQRRRGTAAGWKATFVPLSAPPGGPASGEAVVGRFRLDAKDGSWEILAMLSAGVHAAPAPVPLGGEPFDVHFGCHTRSTICG